MDKRKIIWPNSNREKINLFLSYQLKVIKELKIDFIKHSDNPIKFAELFLSNNLIQSELICQVEYWWEILNSRETEIGIRNSNDAKVIEARIALGLLPVNESYVSDIDFSLSWFLQLLEKGGYDLDVPELIMSQMFSFKA